MPNLLSWSVSQFEIFLLILMRVSPVLFMMPLFNSRNLPVLLKIGLSLMVSLVLWPVVRVETSISPSNPLGFGFVLIGELMIGFILGLSVRLLFSGIQMAGELLGFQMGLAMAKILDPQSGGDASLLSQFYYIVALLVFLSVDGHHWFFRALTQSFHLLSPGALILREGLYRHILTLSGKMFVIAFKMVAPVMAILIFIQIALAIVARTVPQINLLVSSFPLTIGLGLVFLGLSLDLLLPYLRGLFDESTQGLVTTLLPLMKR
jgi:flagellar biosynthetic protein FliR